MTSYGIVTLNKQDKPYKRFQSQGQVQSHQHEHIYIYIYICHALVYRHAKFECNSLNIIRGIAS